LMVSTDSQDTPETIEDFRQRGDVGTLPWAVDQKGEISRALGVNALETTVILDREGEIVYRDTEVSDYETLESELGGVL
jgi:alkyl hydroperoxide reductase subunit AhpC